MSRTPKRLERRHVRSDRVLVFRVEGGRYFMTKAELVAEISEVLDVTLGDSEIILGAILDAVVRAVRGGEKVEIRGFGSFGTRQRKARMGRNPKTGSLVEVPAKRISFFKSGKELKELINAGDRSDSPKLGPDSSSK